MGTYLKSTRQPNSSPHEIHIEALHAKNMICVNDDLRIKFLKGEPTHVHMPRVVSQCKSAALWLLFAKILTVKRLKNNRSVNLLRN